MSTEGGHGGPPLQYVPQRRFTLDILGVAERTVGAALRGRPRLESNLSQGTPRAPRAPPATAIQT